MTTKHIRRTSAELRDDTAILFMIAMMYLTMDPKQGDRAYGLMMAVRRNDERWMAGTQNSHPDAALLDFDYYRDLASITFEI